MMDAASTILVVSMLGRPPATRDCLTARNSSLPRATKPMLYPLLYPVVVLRTGCRQLVLFLSPACSGAVTRCAC